MLVRKALLQDASNVYDLVNSLSTDGTLLKRPFAEICENIRDFTVAESDGGVFLGCGALHLYGPHLSEVRSIVVKPEAKGQGAGGRILGALIEEAEEHGIQSVCLFTRIPDFFFKYGFRTVEDKAELPDKIFKDCQSCPRLHRCDEVAMVRGRIPRMSILGPRHEAQSSFVSPANSLRNFNEQLEKLGAPSMRPLVAWVGYDELHAGIAFYSAPRGSIAAATAACP